MFEIKHYITSNGSDVFAEWRDNLKDSKSKIAVDRRRIYRAELGNFGDHKPCRDGVWELRIDMGPGYRVYYAQAGKTVVFCFAAASSVRRILTYQELVNTGRTGNSAT